MITIGQNSHDESSEESYDGRSTTVRRQISQNFGLKSPSFDFSDEATPLAGTIEFNTVTQISDPHIDEERGQRAELDLTVHSAPYDDIGKELFSSTELEECEEANYPHKCAGGFSEADVYKTSSNKRELGESNSGDRETKKIRYRRSSNFQSFSPSKPLDSDCSTSYIQETSSTASSDNEDMFSSIFLSAHLNGSTEKTMNSMYIEESMSSASDRCSIHDSSVESDLENDFATFFNEFSDDLPANTLYMGRDGEERYTSHINSWLNSTLPMSQRELPRLPQTNTSKDSGNTRNVQGQRNDSDGKRERTFTYDFDGFNGHSSDSEELNGMSLRDIWKTFHYLMRCKGLDVNGSFGRRKLRHYNSLSDAVSLFTRCSKIIVITGAGISVSCGIPDFRSENGIYSMLGEYNLPCPQAMFDIDFFKSNPVPFFKFAKHLLPGNYKPSATHNFIKLLDQKGKLLRNYTQNIDGLEKESQINMERVHQCHGSLDTACCLQCDHEVPLSEIVECIQLQKIPMCRRCNHPKGIMKPNIVFFGEKLGNRFSSLLQQDRLYCDLVVVIGSSLKVSPVSDIIGWIPENVPLVLINRESVGYPHSFDIELLGDSDEIVSSICDRADWELEGSVPLKIPPEFEHPNVYYFSNGKKKRQVAAVYLPKNVASSENSNLNFSRSSGEAEVENECIEQ